LPASLPARLPARLPACLPACLSACLPACLALLYFAFFCLAMRCFALLCVTFALLYILRFALLCSASIYFVLLGLSANNPPSNSTTQQLSHKPTKAQVSKRGRRDREALTIS
jgi:hypothetical protein